MEQKENIIIIILILTILILSFFIVSKIHERKINLYKNIIVYNKI